MSSGIKNNDFVWGLKGQGKDWHGLTVEMDDVKAKEWPAIVRVPLYGAPRVKPGEKVVSLTTGFESFFRPDTGAFIGKPFNPESCKYVLPEKGCEIIFGALEGTGYTVERKGMLWDNSLWFVSVKLSELEKVAPKGHRFQLNFATAFDGSSAFEAHLSDVRVVCNNTLCLSRSTGESLFKLKQTKFSESRYDSVKKETEKAVGMVRVFGDTLKSLESTPATLDETRAVYAGALQRNGAKFERTVKVGSLVETAPGSGLYKRSGSEDFREVRALSTVDALVTAFQRGDGNAGKTRADALNGFTQVWTRGTTEREDKLTTFAGAEFSKAADVKAEFFRTIILPESGTGKNRVASGWDTLKAEGAKALELAGVK